jgi:hypothetical protein
MYQVDIKVVDRRKIPDKKQQHRLSEYLRREGIVSDLLKVRLLLGEYSSVDPKELSVAIVEGKIGNGTIKGKVIELEMPPKIQALDELREMLGEMVGDLKDDQLIELLMAVSSSTVFHEGIHGLLNSKPGSKFHQTLEKISGIEDPQAERSTLLDEGLTYALHGIYAKSVEPIGSLEPKINDSDNELVKRRKKLGQILRPKVESYANEGKTLDRDFLEFALECLVKVK